MVLSYFLKEAYPMTISLMLLTAAITLQADKPFVSKDGGFQVSMPSAPKEQTIKIPSAIGEIEIHLYVVEAGDVAYFVSYNDYPDRIKQADPNLVLEGAVNGSVQNVKGTLISKKDIKLGTIPGKDIEYSMPLPTGQIGTGRSRIYLDNTRLYQVILGGSKDKVVSKSGDAFINSFELIKRAGK